MEGQTTTPTPSERPSFAQAFASNPVTESLPATPSSETPPAASASAETIPPPAGQPSPDATTPASPETPPAVAETGPIPFERHKAILDGAYKERDEARQQLESWKPFDWARSFADVAQTQGLNPREAFQAMATEWQRIHVDPVAHVVDLMTELQDHPIHGPNFRSHAARFLASGRTQTVDLTPDVEIHDAQGRVVGHTLSEGKIKAAIDQGVNNALGQRVAPLEQAHKAQLQAEQQRTFHAEVERRADAELAAAAKWDGYGDHQASIAKALDANPTWSLKDAYLHVLHTEILPARDAKTKALYDAELKTKAAASSMNPSAARITTTKRPTSFTDPSLTW